MPETFSKANRSSAEKRRDESQTYPRSRRLLPTLTGHGCRHTFSACLEDFIQDTSAELIKSQQNQNVLCEEIEEVKQLW